jgi:hypothetical protein
MKPHLQRIKKAEQKQPFILQPLKLHNCTKIANVKKLILGHLSARYDNGKEHELEAKTIFENTEVVEDGTIYSI